MKVLILVLVLFSQILQASEEINVVIVRGLARGIDHVIDLKKTVEEYSNTKNIQLKYYSWDIPGNGKLNEQQAFNNIDDNTEYLRKKYLESGLGDKDSVVLVAISLGGMIATHWIDKYPKDFSQAFLVNTSLKNYCNIFERLRPENIPGFIYNFVFGDAQSYEKKVFEVTINNKEKYDDIVPQWIELRKNYPVSFMNTLRQLWAALSFDPPQRKPLDNVYIVKSEQDHMVSPRCSANIASQWKAPIISHPTAGHDLLNDDATWLFDQILKKNHEKKLAGF
ncbi:MAG: alpha/beta hydrolase [Halobacteriovoraceae bacterium]|nr:alpha/beta hydrolase [Halobacteriovoraceae bacterium]